MRELLGAGCHVFEVETDALVSKYVESAWRYIGSSQIILHVDIGVRSPGSRAIVD
jgi:hypothetical protein